MNRIKSERAANGRFKKGHGGRPKGSKNKRKAYTPSEFSLAVSERASFQLESMLDKALGVIEDRLDQGDARTAIWLIERVEPIARTKLSSALPGLDLSSSDGIVHAAQRVSGMVSNGQLGLDEANRFLTILGNTAGLVAHQKLGELEEQLSAFEMQGKNGPQISASDMPKWGGIEELLTAKPESRLKGSEAVKP